MRCPIATNKGTSAFQQLRQRSDVMKSRMRRAENLKVEISYNYCYYYLNVTFPLSSEICN